MFLWIFIHLEISKVAVTFPNKLQDNWLDLSHSFPLSVKLETVIIFMISDEDNRVPGVCISDRFVGKIVRYLMVIEAIFMWLSVNCFGGSSQVTLSIAPLG